MRKKIVAGNWKMNKTLQEGIELAKTINRQVEENDVIIILCPPFIHLSEVARSITKDSLFAGGQNCASEASGAYTGEVSAEMIRSAGAEYVIIGHSERRTYFNESDELLNKKVKLALANDLTPIFCCGEVLAERQAGKHIQIVKSQVEKGLFDLSPEDFRRIVIAYEPVWAIGTGIAHQAGTDLRRQANALRFSPGERTRRTAQGQSIPNQHCSGNPAARESL